MKKRFVVLVMASIFLIQVMLNYSISFAQGISPNVIVLGDSIAYGASADMEKSFASLFNNYLASEYKNDISLINYAKNGSKSSDLLNELNKQEDINRGLKKADIVVTSIGGNDILQPLLIGLAKIYKIDESDPQLNVKLPEKIVSNLLPAMELINSKEFNEILSNSVNKFDENWNLIINNIKKKAPNSMIYVLNLYNPDEKGSTINLFLEPYITKINKSIENNKSGIRIINLYENFQDSYGKGLVNFSVERKSLDFHPTNAGHDQIFTLLKDDYGKLLYSFSDIRGHWARRRIIKLYEAGDVNGYSNNTFKPDNEITRSEAAVIMAKSLDFDKEIVSGINQLQFIDNNIIPKWAGDYVSIMVKNGIINGFDDKSFRPNKKLNRTDLSVMAVRVLGNDIAKESTTNFKDDGDIPQWAKGYIKKASELGIIKGYPDGNFRPKKNISRGEMCEIMANVKGTLINNEIGQDF